MKLVEADAEGPSAEEPIVTPPRPEKRRVSISLVFTLSVLIATVVTIYVMFPARNNELLAAAVAQHAAAPAWELTAPTEAELRAWMLGTVGGGAPLPSGLPALGASELSVARRSTAVVRYQLPTGELTYVLQRVHSAAPRTSERTADGLRAVQWREGDWLIVGVGKDGEASWLEAARRRDATPARK
jgi:hypothetical protein